MNPATGMPDYSAQWAEYYRSIGYVQEAEKIEQQASNTGNGFPICRSLRAVQGEEQGCRSAFIFCGSGSSFEKLSSF